MADLEAGLRASLEALWLAGVAVYAKAVETGDMKHFTDLVAAGKETRERHLGDVSVYFKTTLVMPAMPPPPPPSQLPPDTEDSVAPPPIPKLPTEQRHSLPRSELGSPRSPGPSPARGVTTPSRTFFGPYPPHSPPPRPPNIPRTSGIRTDLNQFLSAHLEMKASLSGVGGAHDKMSFEEDDDLQDEGGSDEDIGIGEKLDAETLEQFSLSRPASITISSRPSVGAVPAPKPPPRREVSLKKSQSSMDAISPAKLNQEHEYLVQVYDETNGSLCDIWCMKAETFAGIKSRLQQAKNTNFDKKLDLVFSLANSEIFFNDDDFFERCLLFTDLFRTTDTKEQPIEMVLLPRANLGDRPNEKNPTGPVTFGGFLLKLGGKKWRRKFVCLRGRVLYYYLNQKAFVNKEPPDGCISLGGCSVSRIPEPKHKDQKRPWCFEIKGANLGYRNLILCAETEESVNKWIGLIAGFKMQRVKVVIVRVSEELEARGALDTPGLFRVSGDKKEVEGLSVRFAKGEPYDLSFIKDDHAISGLLKVFVRDLHEPLLTTKLYEDWLQISHGREGIPEQLAYVRTKIDQLPASNKQLLKFLMLFLNRVSQRQSLNLMTPNNLAIVFAPNILRPAKPTNEKSVGDLRGMLFCVETLIQQAPVLWPSEEANQLFKKQVLL